MEIKANWPDPNAPRLMLPWFREARRLIDAILQQSRQRGLDQLASDKAQNSSARQIAGQVQQIQETTDQLAAQQSQIIEVQNAYQQQQAALAAQVAFLQTATTYADSTGVASANRGASGGISLDGFDSQYDCSIGVTTSSTGRLRVTVGAQLAGAAGVSAIVGFEVLWSGGSVGVDWTRSATAGGGGQATAQRTALVTVPANTPVTVRTRRGWTGGSGGLCIWSYQSLVVTREGQ